MTDSTPLFQRAFGREAVGRSRAVIRNRVGAIYQKLPIVRELIQIRNATVDGFVADRRLAQEMYSAELLESERYADPKRLTTHEFQVFSQNGEDGAIDEIFKRVGSTNRTFVEVGVGNGQVANTTYLLSSGWKGYWIEGDAESVTTIRHRFSAPIASRSLALLEAFVTKENIGQLLRQLDIPKEIDLLSVDIDRNTYWVLGEILKNVSARALVVEYNANYPCEVEWKVEYSASRWWDGSSYFGASLKSYELLCRSHGFELVGCDSHGVNAFFVRRDLCGNLFHEPFTAEEHYEPARYYLIRTPGHPPSYSD